MTYQQLPLGSVCQLTPGPSGALLANLTDGYDGVPVVAPPDITDTHAIETRRLRRVPTADVGTLARFALREGDILFVRQGALGRFAVIDAMQAGWFYSSACMRLRPRTDRLLPAYLAACLTHEPLQRTLLGKAHPGTVPSLNTAALDEFVIPVPRVAEQQAITQTLSDIESSVRAHRAIADRLESLSQAILGESIASAWENQWES